MITVTRLDGREMVVNCDLILTVEQTPDTVLTLTTGTHILVKERVDDIIDRTVAYRRRLLGGPSVLRLVESPHSPHNREA